MKNASDHPIRGSMQSVTQYDTADSRDAANYNRNFWAFAPINPHRAYTDGYRVRMAWQMIHHLRCATPGSRCTGCIWKMKCGLTQMRAGWQCR